MSKNKNKSLKKLEKEHNYYKGKVEEMEQERSHDRTWSSKALLVKMKKLKLDAKTKIMQLKQVLGI